MTSIEVKSRVDANGVLNLSIPFKATYAKSSFKIRP